MNKLLSIVAILGIAAALPQTSPATPEEDLKAYLKHLMEVMILP